jgi:outer membrane protein TolC
MKKVKIDVSLSKAAATLCAATIGVTLSGAQTDTQPIQATSTGTIPLPKGVPPTSPTGPLPKPLLPLPADGHILASSIDEAKLNEVVKDKTLTIDDAVAIALATNRELATAVSMVRKARGITNETKAALAPQAGIGGQITEYDQNTTITFFGTTITQINQFNPVYTGQVSMPLDITGAIHSAVSQAQFNELAARIDISRVRNNVVFNVRNAFYQALRAQGQLAVATDNLTNAETRLADASKGLGAGLSSRFDVITVQRDVADAQQSVVNARGQVTLALGQLKSIIGIKITTPIKISDASAVEQPPGVRPVNIAPPDAGATDAQAPPPVAAPPTPTQGELPIDVHQVQDLTNLGPEYMSAVKEAVDTRPEILESDAQIAAAQKGILYARRSQLPSLGLQLQYIYQPDATIFTRPHQALATLMVNVPLYDGGVGAARVQQAQADIESAKTARRTAEDGVTLDVQQAYVALVQSRDRVQVTEAEVAQAKEAFRLARVRYEAGVSQTPTVSPQLELSNAQSALTQAETNRLNALYDYNVARSQLDRSIGRFSYGVGPGFITPPKLRKH